MVLSLHHPLLYFLSEDDVMTQILESLGWRLRNAPLQSSHPSDLTANKIVPKASGRQAGRG